MSELRPMMAGKRFVQGTLSWQDSSFVSIQLSLYF